MIDLTKLPPADAERIAYTEGFTGVGELFARISDLEHALEVMVYHFGHYVEGDPSDEEVQAFENARELLP
jgi:hypothetical protein